MNSISALIVSAGEGKRFNPKRMGSNIPKPYALLKHKPIIAWTLEIFDNLAEVNDITVVTHPKWIEYCKSEVIDRFGIKKVKYVVEGGEHRQDSVRLGLKVMDGEEVQPQFVLIHDAVRPFITKEFLTYLIKETESYDAIVPGVPIINTIKETRDGFVFRTLEREKLYEIQTPQVFKVNKIKEAHDSAFKSNFYATDDSALMERIGVKVKLAEGLKQNIKITTAADLVYAEYWVGKLSRSSGD